MAEDMRRTRQISVTVCTSSPEDNIKALLNYLKDITRERSGLVKNVSYYKLPYNGLDKHKFTSEDHVDVMILCHSIQNRRFAITDVPDALYDKFLLNCQKSIGKEKIAVIAHDVEGLSNEKYSDRCSSFHQAQPTVFDRASLVMMYGRFGEGEKLTQTFTDLIINFLREASQQPLEMKSWLFSNMPSFSMVCPGSARTSHPENANLRNPSHAVSTTTTSGRALATADRTPPSALLNPPNDQQPKATPSAHSGRVVTSQTHYPAQRSLSPRPVSVSVCTSAFEHNVTGFMTWLRKLKANQPHMIADVRFRKLPYNDIDSFKFSQADPVDVMVLCHSVHNRGFLITDVLNSIYDKYLKYCFKEYGKKRMAVIVHDISESNSAAVGSSKMETFKKTQPSTFKLADTVIICGSLENSEELQMTETNMGALFSFFESASMEPRKTRSYFGKNFLMKM